MIGETRSEEIQTLTYHKVQLKEPNNRLIIESEQDSENKIKRSPKTQEAKQPQISLNIRSIVHVEAQIQRTRSQYSRQTYLQNIHSTIIKTVLILNVNFKQNSIFVYSECQEILEVKTYKQRSKFREFE
ncbi:unnamed protein product [Paramecium sonneborni]|uniref:Uncharacterized protein n=1 Tax=Paramecium sonneborni TaxID=65129 RepID=A0A8S1RUE9_9CILI|nr:unnamed protein product [Paramecium sonneborni]